MWRCMIEQLQHKPLGKDHIVHNTMSPSKCSGPLNSPMQVAPDHRQMFWNNHPRLQQNSPPDSPLLTSYSPALYPSNNQEGAQRGNMSSIYQFPAPDSHLRVASRGLQTYPSSQGGMRSPLTTSTFHVPQASVGYGPLLPPGVHVQIPPPANPLASQQVEACETTLTVSKVESIHGIAPISPQQPMDR